jgi:hypothetical protein
VVGFLLLLAVTEGRVKFESAGAKGEGEDEGEAEADEEGGNSGNFRLADCILNDSVYRHATTR